MSKRTHRDKSISTESFDSDLVVIRPKKRLSREIPATVQAQPGNSGEDAGSESFDSDTIVVRPKKRLSTELSGNVQAQPGNSEENADSEFVDSDHSEENTGSEYEESDTVRLDPKNSSSRSSKGKGKVVEPSSMPSTGIPDKGKGKAIEYSSAKLSTKRRWSNTEKDFLLNKQNELRDWDKVAQAFRAKFPSRADKLGIQVENPRKSYISCTKSEKEYLLQKYEELGDWNDIAAAFRNKFESKADVTVAQLQDWRSKWQIKLTAEAGGTPRTIGKKFTEEEFEFIVNERSRTKNFETIAKSFRARFKDRKNVTEPNLRAVFRRLKDGQYKNVSQDLRKRALACPGTMRREETSNAEGQKTFRFLTEYEKEWLAAQHRSSIPWQDVCKLFREKFHDTANVDRLYVKQGLRRYLESRGSSLGEVKQLNRAELDIEILKIHQRQPEESWPDKAAEIMQTEAYRKNYPTTTMEAESFGERSLWLETNNITIEKLTLFVSQGAGPKPENSYKNAIGSSGLRQQKRKAKANDEGSEEDSSLNELSEEDEEADENGNVDDDDDDDDDVDSDGVSDDDFVEEGEIEELSKAVEDSDISSLTELVSQ